MLILFFIFKVLLCRIPYVVPVELLNFFLTLIFAVQDLDARKLLSNNHRACEIISCYGNREQNIFGYVCICYCVVKLRWEFRAESCVVEEFQVDTGRFGSWEFGA